ncbi:galactosyl transferase GMA12/MNN10 family protein [Algoriphagus boseongensis]|uniref:Galactosyl transferase GMA12/MNN10 family protein n=1 Tax=Algoriphagus boseongensis TaxID=1442587 RepID=A0A4R6T861_9BACT|nr:hypothetical protein [Algoriphagus boseongensis]TDQ18891.1 galactosyl transferase GMA12/MNN10 family protein [Algoriphagus boseongensis]
MSDKRKICLVSGHYPSGVLFAELTRLSLEEYAKTHGYDLYYDAETPVPSKVSELHFRRCLLLLKASEKYPDAEWYIWLDTDIYVQFMDRRIEEFIDLSDPNILYHLFHERPKGFPVNTGVKLVHRSAIHWEQEIHDMRHDCPFPFEQKIVAEHIIPKYKEKIIVHDPYYLNCILGKHDTSGALFVHVCGNSEANRNVKILKNTRKIYQSRKHLLQTPHYQKFYFHFLTNYSKRVFQAGMKALGLGN